MARVEDNRAFSKDAVDVHVKGVETEQAVFTELPSAARTSRLTGEAVGGVLLVGADWAFRDALSIRSYQFLVAANIAVGLESSMAGKAVFVADRAYLLE